MPCSSIGRLAEDVATIRRSTTQLLHLAQQSPASARASTEGRGDHGGMPPATDSVNLILSVRSLHALELLTQSEIHVDASSQAIACASRTLTPMFIFSNARPVCSFTHSPPNQRLPKPFYHLKYAAKEHLQGRPAPAESVLSFEIRSEGTPAGATSACRIRSII